MTLFMYFDNCIYSYVIWCSWEWIYDCNFISKFHSHMFFYVAASFSLYCGSSKLGLFYMMLNLGIGKFT